MRSREMFRKKMELGEAMREGVDEAWGIWK